MCVDVCRCLFHAPYYTINNAAEAPSATVRAAMAEVLYPKKTAVGGEVFLDFGLDNLSARAKANGLLCV